MKPTARMTLFLLLCLAPFAQEQHDVMVVNIEIPVRVVDNGSFVDNLRPQDFEIYEDDHLQEVRSLYLIRNATLQRQEGSSWSTPQTARRFFMLFQLLDYNPQLNESLDYFFAHIIRPEDTLTVVTPLKRYDLSREALKNQPPEKLSRDLLTVLRKDIKIGSGDYNNLIGDLKKIVRSISSATGDTSAMSGIESMDSGSGFGLDFQLPRYKETLERLDELRMVSESKFLAFAGQMKRIEGQKVLFFFYQREFRPEIEPRILNLLVSMYQDQPNILSNVQDLFTMYSRTDKMNADHLGQAFSDASTSVNFIFMHKEPENVRGVVMREQSEDVFDTFVRVAKGTGGIVDNSQNPSQGFRSALDACTEYYLLVYSPSPYLRDGRFKTIKVAVKGRDYRVIHRSGYYAN